MILEDKPIIFLGDHHGDWNTLFYLIKKNNLENCNLISVGDCGIGFSDTKKQLNQLKNLNKDFAEKNIRFKAIRGNHDDPSWFKRSDLQLEYVELIEDYSIYKYRNKLIQFIGGAISIDRTGRRAGVSYWKNECLTYVPEKCQKVDILVTHTAPFNCFPQTFNELVYGWASEDADLIEDLTNERKVMDEIFKKCDPALHLYGHFHSSWSERINNCTHRLLDINELWELKL